MPAARACPRRKSRQFNLDASLRELWEATDLSAAEFADEVSDYFGVVRLSLPQLLAATPMSRRILPALPARVHDLPVPRAERRHRSRSPIPPIPRPSAPPRSCSAIRSRSWSPRSRTSPPCWTSASSDDGAATDEAAKLAPAIRRRHREPARPRQRRAGGARGQRSARARGRTARQRHSHRAVPHRACRAHARRRPAARDAGAAGRPAAGADLAHQDSRRSQHRRAAPAAGRRGARARRRSEIDIRVATMPTQHGESAVIRLLPRDRGLLDMGKLGLSARDEDDHAPPARAAARHDRRHRPDRQRQDHDARHHAVDPQRADAQDPHHRGSGRIRDPRHQPVAGQAVDRSDLCHGDARLRAPGSRRHHGRRNPRRRDRAYRDPRRADRPSGADHAAHRDRGRRRAAAARSRRRRLPAEVDAARGDRAAAGARAVRSLQDARTA